MTTELNWAGNVRFRAAEVARPESVEELQSVVAGAREVRALGTRHSFNPVADTRGTLVVLGHLGGVVDVDSERRRATVPAGMRYAEVNTRLHEAGFGLASQASLPHLSVGGACATGSHGSGHGLQPLSSAVMALQMVSASGDLVLLRRGDPGFDGSVVALGALGVVTHVELDLVPTYDVSQWVYRDLPMTSFLDHVEEVMGAAYSVCVFTTWKGTCDVWVQQRVGDAASDLTEQEWFEAIPEPATRHPVAGQSAAACTTQAGVAGPWHERLPHFRAEAEPSSRGEELQSEYMVAAEDAPDALRALTAVVPVLAPALQTCEVRVVSGDDQWLSPCGGRRTVSIHFTWTAEAARVEAAVRAVELALAPWHPRPHWGKVFRLGAASVRPEYPRLADFLALAELHDPDHKFGNRFLHDLIGLPVPALVGAAHGSGGLRAFLSVPWRRSPSRSVGAGLRDVAAGPTVGRAGGHPAPHP